jgi:Tol biopolymer transport system component
MRQRRHAAGLPLGALLICVAVLLSAPAWAGATFPGRNGTIAFQNDLLGGIYTIEPDGSHLRRIARHAFEPTWSPDGRHIVYTSTSGGYSEIAVMRADGSRSRDITHDRAAQWEPTWSPDGRWIAYRGGRTRHIEGRLYVMRADGTRRRRIGIVGQSPDWSVPLPGVGSAPAAPQGRIAFAGPPTAPCFGGYVNYTVEPDGTGLVAPFTCSTAFDPSWSPDGTRLAFASYTLGAESTDIFAGDPMTGTTTQLADRPGYDYAPAWSPDGSEIVFGAAGRGGGLDMVDPAAPLTETLIPHTSGLHAARPDWGTR